MSDDNYYKYIFKKTEKIVCSVFYIISHSDKSQKIVFESLTDAAKFALDSVLDSLRRERYAAREALYTLLSGLLALESNIRLAEAASLMSGDVADLLSSEIRAVSRALKQYLVYEREMAASLSDLSADDGFAAIPSGFIRPRAMRRKGEETASSRTEPDTKGHHGQRRQAIKDILSADKELSIKDISNKMTGISEKTLQREINAMVNAGIILKKGAKRWSRYSLALGA